MSYRLGSRDYGRRCIAAISIIATSMMCAPAFAAATTSSDAAAKPGLTTRSLLAQSKTTTPKPKATKTATSEPNSKEPTSSSPSSSPNPSPSPKPRPEPRPFSVGAKTQWGEDLQKRIDAATDEVDQKTAGQIALAVYDRQNNELICNARCEDAFQLASLAKIFVAESVAYTNYTPSADGKITAGHGDMPVIGNQDAMLRDDAVRYSDNEATSALWARYGRGEIFEDIARRYALSEATQPMGAWGASTSSAMDMVRLYDGIADGTGKLSKTESDYLISLLYSLPRYSYGSADQNFGLRAALPKEKVGNKSGWIDNRVLTTTGFVGGEQRYIVSALSSGLTTEQFTDTLRDTFPTGSIADDDSDSAGNQSENDNAGQFNAADARAETQSTTGAGLWPLWLLVFTAVGFSAGWIVRGFRASSTN